MAKKDAAQFVFTKPKLSDAKDAMEYVNSLIEEKAQIAAQKKLNLKREKEFIKNAIKDMKDKKGITFFVKDEKSKNIIGWGNITKNKFDCSSHVASIGIGVKKGCRNNGLGSLLLKKLIKEGRKISGVKIIHLNVFSINKDAIRFYKRHGFKIVGKSPKWVNHYGKYCDMLDMYYKWKG